MAIIWKEPVDRYGKTKPTWDGAVLMIETPTVQLMSDVWADSYDAIVWNGRETERVICGNSEFGSSAEIVVDATPAVVAAYEAWGESKRLKQLAADAAHRLAQQIETAKSQVMSIRKGRRIRTVAARGRGAPPVGTEGIVTWTGYSSFGVPRIGMRDNSGQIWWTTEKNCVVVLPGLTAGQEPACGWVAYRDELEKAEKAAEAAEAAKNPAVGAKVRLKGTEYTVFWAKGPRLGLKVNAKDRNEDPVWCNTADLDSDEAAPADLDLATLAADITKVADLPAPFCEIRYFADKDGGLAAFNVMGQFVMFVSSSMIAELS